MKKKLKLRAIFLVIGVCNLYSISADSKTLENNYYVSRPSEENGNLNVQLKKYDASIYDLAYQVFLQNRNMQDAFAIANAAVDQNPNNGTWREKLISVSLWNGKPLVALNSYLYFSEHNNDKAAFITGLTMARKIHADEALSQFLALKIKRGEQPLPVWQEYIDTLIKIGELQTAITQLINHKDTINPYFYFNGLITLYDALSEINLLQKTLNQYNAQLGVTPFSAYRQTQIDLSKGNFHHAFIMLNAASKRAIREDWPFWLSYAYIARLQQNEKVTIKANVVLLTKPQPPSESYKTLISIYNGRDPNKAYFYAKKARYFYPDEIEFTQHALTYADILGDFTYIPKLINTSSFETKHNLVKDPNFWEIKAGYWQQQNKPSLSAWTYQQGLKRFPNDDGLISSYIDLLITENRMSTLKTELSKPRSNICIRPRLWQSYASGSVLLHHYKQTYALTQLYSQQFSQYKQDPYWLIDFKEFLERASEVNVANEVGHYAWQNYNNYLKNQKTPIGYDQLIYYAKLVVDEAPGDLPPKVFTSLQKTLTPDVASLMLSWSISIKEYALAQLIYNFYIQSGWRPSANLLTNLALNDQDNYLLRQLLIEHGSELTATDRIDAAQKIGATAISQEWAYQGLGEQPGSHQMYDDYFVPVMLKHADYIDFRQQYYQYGPEEGPRTIVNTSFNLTPTIQLMPYGSIWLLKSNSTTDLATTPDKDAQAGMKADIIQPHGDLLLDLGYRDNLDNFVTAKIQKNYLITPQINAIFLAGLNQPADDTPALLIGGMKQVLSADVRWDINSRDSLGGAYTQNFFYTQDWDHLSNGQQEDLRLRHQFSLSYPNFAVSGYSSFVQYFDKANSVSPLAASLIPPGDQANANFFLPDNFIEYGVTLEMGENYHEDYSHDWRPFASATVLNNTESGFGTLYDVGIGGSVFGGDHLAFYYQEGNNSSIGVGKTRLIEFMYQFYF